jgi:hypothetical protein
MNVKDAEALYATCQKATKQAKEVLWRARDDQRDYERRQERKRHVFVLSTLTDGEMIVEGAFSTRELAREARDTLSGNGEEPDRWRIDPIVVDERN